MFFIRWMTSPTSDASDQRTSSDWKIVCSGQNRKLSLIETRCSKWHVDLIFDLIDFRREKNFEANFWVSRKFFFARNWFFNFFGQKNFFLDRFRILIRPSDKVWDCCLHIFKFIECFNSDSKTSTFRHQKSDFCQILSERQIIGSIWYQDFDS